MIKIPGKIPIFIHPAFWAVACFIAWLGSASIDGIILWVPIILVSVLFHEYGHALTAVAFGQSAKIELIGFGGMTYRHSRKALKGWQEFLVVLNGPLAGFLLALCAWSLRGVLAASHPESPLTYVLSITFDINLFWTILNLIPVMPLDGGKLLSVFLEGLFGIRGKKIALFLGLIFAATMGVLFMTIQAYLPGAFFLLFTFENYRAWKQVLSMTEQDSNFILQHELKAAERDLAHGHQQEALHRLLHLREMTQSGMLYFNATEQAAHILVEQGDLAQAHSLLTSIEPKLSPAGVHLLHQVAYQQKNWEEAIALGKRVYREHPDYHTALINALCHAMRGEAYPALGWLQCAINEGIPDIRLVLSRKEFDPIKNDPLFLQFQANIR